MRLTLTCVFSLFLLSLSAQSMKLVKASATRDVTADKKVLGDDYFVDFEKKTGETFVIDSVKSTAGNKKVSYTFFRVEMMMSKDDVQWNYQDKFAADATGLFQLRIKKTNGAQNKPAVNAGIDLTKGFTVYARENGKPVTIKVEKIEGLPDIEQR